MRCDEWSGAEVQYLTLIAFVTCLCFVDDSSAADKLIGLHSAPAVSQALPWIARDAGLFKKYNLDFDLVYIQAAAAAAAAMIGGDAEIALTGPDVRVAYAAAVFVTRQGVLNRRPQVIAQFMRAMAEAAKIFHNDLPFTYKVLAKNLRIDDPKILDAAYKYEAKSLEPRLDIRADGLQAIFDDVSTTEPRAKAVNPQQVIDRRFLDEMDRSGFFDKLWGVKH